MNAVVCKECGYSFTDKEPGNFCGAKPGELYEKD